MMGVAERVRGLVLPLRSRCIGRRTDSGNGADHALSSTLTISDYSIRGREGTPRISMVCSEMHISRGEGVVNLPTNQYHGSVLHIL